MTATELFGLLPLIIQSVTILVVLLVIAFYRSHRLTLVLTLLGMALALASLFVVAPLAPLQVTTLLVIDNYALFLMGLLLACSLVVALLSYDYLEKYPGNREEYYVLLLLAVLGSLVLVAANHFASFFLGLEILSVSLYALIAYVRKDRLGLEAGLKYLTLAAASAAFLLFGMAFIYTSEGTMEFTHLIRSLEQTNRTSLYLMTGVGMLIVGLGFKLAVVPFHLWVPDVYEGAPAPVTAFIATVSKGAVFALLLRFFIQTGTQPHGPIYLVFVIIAIASMLAGSILALLQKNLKRILAYSSIAHLGYLLVAFLAGGAQAVNASIFYLVAYLVTSLGAFGVISVISSPGAEKDALEDYRGLFWSRPWLAGALAGMLFSLGGIPLTAGFVGKFFILQTSVGSAGWLLAISLVVSSAISIYYYLNVIVMMYRELPEAPERVSVLPAVPLTGGAVLAVLVVAVVWLGIYPSPLLDLILRMTNIF